MPETVTETAANGGSSHQRLIDAVLDGWAEHGHAGISTRSLAQGSGLTVSSIYHHFGSLDHLYLSAQDDARTAAERWCAIRLADIAGPQPLPPTALPGLLAALIDDWSQEQRRLALAWRECYMLAVRDDRYHPALEGWRQLWGGFCEALCARCDLAGYGELTSLFFDGESVLHLTRWHRTVDRAALDEMCAGWGRWLSGALAPEGPWRQFAREAALRAIPATPMPSGIAETIAGAAADIVERRGVAGLTHRAVAAAAGLTLGIVSHNAHTSADLARIAFEMIYRRVVASAAPRANASTPDRDAKMLAGSPVPPAQMLAMDELLMAVVRDPAFQPFASQLRYLRGRSSGVVLQSILGSELEVSPLDAALFSAVLSGLKRTKLGQAPDDHELYADRVLAPLLQHLQSG